MNSSPFSILRFRVNFSIWWLAIICDHALILYFLGLQLHVAIFDSLISNLLLMVSCLAVIQILRFYLPRGRQYMNIFFICIFLTGTWFIFSKWLLKFLLSHYAGYADFLHHSLSVRFSIGFLLLGFISMISILW